MTAFFFLSCIFITVIVHRGMIFIFPRSSRQKTTAWSCAVGALVAVITIPFDSWPLAALIALTAVHVYFHFFNMSETARRIKLLLQIEAGEDPRRAYSSELVVEKRLRRLLDLDIIVVSDGKYFLRKKGLARVAYLMQHYERWLFPERA